MVGSGGLEGIDYVKGCHAQRVFPDFSCKPVPFVVDVVGQASVFVGYFGYVHIFVILVCEGAEDFSGFPFMGDAAQSAFGIVSVFGEYSVGVLDYCGSGQFVVAVMVLVAKEVSIFRYPA